MKVATMGEFVNNGFEDTIEDFTKNGECSSCGNCCGRVLPLSKKEIDTIKNYIKKYNIKGKKHAFPYKNRPVDFTCPFRDDALKICTIYEVRPKICRKFICNNEERAKVNREQLLKDNRKVIDTRKEFFDDTL